MAVDEGHQHNVCSKVLPSTCVRHRSCREFHMGHVALEIRRDKDNNVWLNPTLRKSLHCW